MTAIEELREAWEKRGVLSTAGMACLELAATRNSSHDSIMKRIKSLDEDVEGAYRFIREIFTKLGMLPASPERIKSDKPNLSSDKLQPAELACDMMNVLKELKGMDIRRRVDRNDALTELLDTMRGSIFALYDKLNNLGKQPDAPPEFRKCPTCERFYPVRPDAPKDANEWSEEMEISGVNCESYKEHFELNGDNAGIRLNWEEDAPHLINWLQQGHAAHAAESEGRDE